MTEPDSLADITQILVAALHDVLSGMIEGSFTFPLTVTIAAANGHVMQATVTELDAEPTIVSSDGNYQSVFLYPFDLFLADASGKKAGVQVASDMFARKVQVMNYDSQTVN